jgi:hypothetical protein
MGSCAQLRLLEALLTPPRTVVAATPWELSRAEVGFDFPSDYRAFIDRYGGGTLTRAGTPMRFSVMNPGEDQWCPDGPSGFAGFVDVTVSELRPRFAGGCPDAGPAPRPARPGARPAPPARYPVLPDPGGLLAWGSTDDGDCFFWLTQDPDPDRWPVVLWSRCEEAAHRFDGGMVEFLLAVLRGEHPASAWLSGPEPRWTPEADWNRRELPIYAGLTRIERRSARGYRRQVRWAQA